MVLGRAWEFRPFVSQRVGGQLVEGIAAEWRQITLRERAAKHPATEVLEGTPPAEGCQSGWFNYMGHSLRLTGHRLRPRAMALNRATTTAPPPTIPSKAGKGIRTLDIQLGKLTLYQLSYARELWSVYQWGSCCWLLVAGCCYVCTRLVFTPPKPARLPVLLRSYS